MKRVRKGMISSLLAAGIAVACMSTVKAQRTVERRGGPRDWSHANLVAAGWGADDPGVRRNWRTLRKHILLEEARQRRTPEAEWMAWFNRLARRPATSTSTSSSDVKLDWSLSSGGTGSVVGYPAKYSFDITAANCSDVI